ncbi:MAG: hypothetical protein KF706_12765 [Chitinophagales bacterium]|nr:hypothetical protein [Chitinophagales bacterium]
MLAIPDFVYSSADVAVKILATFGVFFLSFFSFVIFEIVLVTKVFVQRNKQAGVFNMVQKLVRNTIFNLSFHFVLWATISVFLFVKAAWWWFFIVLFIATAIVFYVLQNSVVMYFSWKFRKYIKYYFVFKNIKKFRG